jgi:membrane-bound lytic murein transglycosylase B
MIYFFRFLVISIFVFSLSPEYLSSAPLTRKYTKEEQQSIAQVLFDTGMSQTDIAAIELEVLEFYPSALKINLHGRDSAEFYKTFQGSSVIVKLRKFLQEKSALFSQVEKEYGVPRQVIGAIIMIESRLGENWGSFNVPALLLSLQLLERGAASGANLDSAIVREKRDGGQRTSSQLASTLRKRAEKRSNWALKEFLRFQEQFPRSNWAGKDGSWAGAMGIPQFIPSSRASYAVDGDADGIIDLYTFADAIASVGNYLRENGWRGKMSREKHRKVIRRYNHSDNYVDAVLGLAISVGFAGE